MLSQDRVMDIYSKLKNGEFAVLFTSQKSFKVLGSWNNQVRDYTNDLAFFTSLAVKTDESLLEFVARSQSDKWRYKEKITMQGGGYDYAGEFFSGVAVRFKYLKGFESLGTAYPNYTRL